MNKSKRKKSVNRPFRVTLKNIISELSTPFFRYRFLRPASRTSQNIFSENDFYRIIALKEHEILETDTRLNALDYQVIKIYQKQRGELLLKRFQGQVLCFSGNSLVQVELKLIRGKRKILPKNIPYIGEHIICLEQDEDDVKTWHTRVRSLAWIKKAKYVDHRVLCLRP